MTSKSWPRAERDDPLIPNHILPRRLLQPVSLPDRDRENFNVIVGQASCVVILSRSRRSGQGALQSPSALWNDTNEESLGRSRIPEHAFSESDRLLARPKEAVKTARVNASRECWQDWGREMLTAHDGAVRSPHPVIERSLDGVQSTTSIRRLLRDPLGFVWRYGLGWQSPEFEQQPLALPPRAFGELVHELIRRTIETLEPEPGFARSSEADIENAMNKAVAAVAEAWPLARAVPPNILWRHTLNEAARLTRRGLTVDDHILGGTRSWVEVPFGETEPSANDALPWDPCREVRIVGTNVRFGGRIDRLDLRETADAVRISDYKSGEAPKNAKNIIIEHGNELQRVLYAMATRQLLPETRTIVSRLVYLSGNTAPFALTGNVLDEAIEDVAGFIAIACNALRNRGAVSGPDGLDKYNDLRLALPSDREAYFQRKQSAFSDVNKDLSRLWDRR
ncbi:PD-(D/E)XK nuclease family protein [Phyllobacterium chamaecytisi]|uniref:PD-(D/E)XK nuclease family protein n=1 Tax=Phyllobacterium chamaecytisi TaxID=2876082 RepID=UPI001CC9083D|nr:PD-(D/E)XK nuclease family protein [Phyllobacterium sp. KW56]MBZ9605046.1 PD-(D/E)XK nuclease family protein [Phyllobacterium sp. KW56]